MTAAVHFRPEREKRFPSPGLYRAACGHVTRGMVWTHIAAEVTCEKCKNMLAELAALKALPDSAIDTSDIPETTDWSNAVRGRFAGKPK